MGGLVPFTQYARGGSAAPAGPGGFQPKYLLLHDYGGNPRNEDSVFNPYHALVFPDGSVRYRNPSNPYGQPAPHAFKLNPLSVGLSYAGPVGSMPTPEAMAKLNSERDAILKQYPGLKILSHGEAYQQTRGTSQQASRDGRGLDEARWRSSLGGPIPPQNAAPEKAVADHQQRAPMASGLAAAAPEAQGGFGDYINRVMGSPLFLAGAGMLDPRQSIGSAIGHGVQQAGEANINRLKMKAYEDEQAKRHQLQSMWGNLGGLGLTPEQQRVLATLGPDAGSGLLMQLVSGKAQQELANSDPMRQAQIADIPLNRKLKEAQIAQATRKDALGEAQARILQGTFPELFGGQSVPMGAPQTGFQLQGLSAQPAAPGITLIDDRMQAPPQSVPTPMPMQQPQTFQGLDPRKAFGLSLVPGMGDAAKIGLDAYNQGRLGKEGMNEIDKKSINSSEQQARLLTIKGLFKPEYQQFDTKFGMGWRALVDKIGMGAKLAPEDQKMLEGYTAYRAEAYDNLNQYVKEITGAAMTNAEAERIMKAIPNPGENWWDGDGPTQFKGKLDQAIRKTQMAIARYEYAKRAGKPWQSIPLTQLPDIIDKRGSEIEGKLKMQGMRGDELNGAVRQQLRAEFGIES